MADDEIHESNICKSHDLEGRSSMLLEPYSVTSLSDHAQSLTVETTMKEYHSLPLSDLDNKHVFQSPLSQFCSLIDTADIPMVSDSKSTLSSTVASKKLSQLSSSPFHPVDCAPPETIFDDSDITKSGDNVHPLVVLPFDTMSELMGPADDSGLPRNTDDPLPIVKPTSCDLDQTWDLFSQAGWEVQSDALLPVQTPEELTNTMQTSVWNPSPTLAYADINNNNNQWPDTSLSGWNINMTDDVEAAASGDVTQTPRHSSVHCDNLTMTPVSIVMAAMSGAQLTSTPAHSYDVDRCAEKLPAAPGRNGSNSRRRYQPSSRTFSRSFSRSYVYNSSALSKGPYCNRHSDCMAGRTKVGNFCQFDATEEVRASNFPQLTQPNPASNNMYGPVSAMPPPQQHLIHERSEAVGNSSCMVVISTPNLTVPSAPLIVTTEQQSQASVSTRLIHPHVYQDSGIEITPTGPAAEESHMPGTPVSDLTPAFQAVPMYHSTPTTYCDIRPSPVPPPPLATSLLQPHDRRTVVSPLRPVPQYAVPSFPAVQKPKNKMAKQKPPLTHAEYDGPLASFITQHPHLYNAGIVQPNTGKIGQPQVSLPPPPNPPPLIIAPPTPPPDIGQPMVFLPQPLPSSITPAPPYTLMNRKQPEPIKVAAPPVPPYRQLLSTPQHIASNPPPPVSPQPLSIQIKSLRHVMSSLDQLYDNNTLMHNLRVCYEQKAGEIETIRHAYLLRLPSVELMLNAVNQHFDTEHKKLLQWCFTQATLIVQLMDRAQEQAHDTQAIEHMVPRVAVPSEDARWQTDGTSTMKCRDGGQSLVAGAVSTAGIATTTMATDVQQPHLISNPPNVTSVVGSNELQPPPPLQRHPHFSPQEHIVGYALIDNCPVGFQHMIKPLSSSSGTIAQSNDDKRCGEKQKIVGNTEGQSEKAFTRHTDVHSFPSRQYNKPAVMSTMDLEDLGFTSSPKNACNTSILDMSSFYLAETPSAKNGPEVHQADSTSDLAIVVQPDAVTGNEQADQSSAKNAENADQQKYYCPYLNRDLAIKDSLKKSGKKRKKKMLMSLAVKILEKWYERNCLHPYPTPEAAAVLAEAGNLTVEQVRKWMANKRLRSGNTKKVCEIAAARRLKKLTEILASPNSADVAATLHRLSPALYIEAVKRDMVNEVQCRSEQQRFIKTTYTTKNGALTRIDWRKPGKSCEDRVIGVVVESTGDKEKGDVRVIEILNDVKEDIVNVSDEGGMGISRDDEKADRETKSDEDFENRKDDDDVDDVTKSTKNGDVNLHSMHVKKEHNLCRKIVDRVNILSKNAIRLNLKTDNLKARDVLSDKNPSVKSKSGKKARSERKSKIKKSQENYFLRWDGNLRSRQPTGRKRQPLHDREQTTENGGNKMGECEKEEAPLRVMLVRENKVKQENDKSLIVGKKDDSGVKDDNNNTTSTVKGNDNSVGKVDEDSTMFVDTLNCGFECLLDSSHDTHHDVTSLDLSFVENI